jgi:hypothetical protein
MVRLRDIELEVLAAYLDCKVPSIIGAAPAEFQIGRLTVRRCLITGITVEIPVALRHNDNAIEVQALAMVKHGMTLSQAKAWSKDPGAQEHRDLHRTICGDRTTIPALLTGVQESVKNSPSLVYLN